jgi:hypothetical protein
LEKKFELLFFFFFSLPFSLACPFFLQFFLVLLFFSSSLFFLPASHRVGLREKVKQRMRGIERVRDWKRERCRERESERSGDREERTRGDPATWGPTSDDARQSGGSCGAGLTPEEQEARCSVLGRRSGARDAGFSGGSTEVRFPVARTEIRRGRERGV